MNVTNALNVGWDGIGLFNLTGGVANVGSVEIDASGNDRGRRRARRQTYRQRGHAQRGGGSGFWS